MSKHVYQFCGEYQLDNGSTGKYDGIIESSNKILDFKEYTRMKKTIFVDLKNEILDYKKITIVSMCYLGSK